MKILIYKIGLFAVLFLIGNFILHYSYKNLIYAKTDNGRKEKQFNNYEGKLKFLFIGDSHSQNAINPEYIDNSFNYSSALENFIQTYYKLTGIVNKLDRHPEYIVLPIDITSFSSFRAERFRNISSLLGFKDYLELAIDLDDPKFMTYWLENKTFMYGGKYETIFRFLSSLNKKRFSDMKLGFKGRKGDLTYSDNISLECADKAKLYLDGHEYFDPILVRYFEKILTFCDQNNIKVILMKMPLATEYQKSCNKIFNVDDMYFKIGNISKQHKSVSSTFDYSNYFRIDQSNFRNPDHLSIKGAENFSKMLGNKLIEF